MTVLSEVNNAVKIDRLQQIQTLLKEYELFILKHEQEIDNCEENIEYANIEIAKLHLELSKLS